MKDVRIPRALCQEGNFNPWAFSYAKFLNVKRILPRKHFYSMVIYLCNVLEFGAHFSTEAFDPRAFANG